MKKKIRAVANCVVQRLICFPRTNANWQNKTIRDHYFDSMEKYIHSRLPPRFCFGISKIIQRKFTIDVRHVWNGDRERKTVIIENPTQISFTVGLMEKYFVKSSCWYFHSKSYYTDVYENEKVTREMIIINM